MKQRIVYILVGLVLIAVPLLALYGAELPPVPTAEGVADGSYFSALDTHIADNLPMRTRLRRVSLTLSLLGGQQEQNDVFITRDGLIVNIPASDPDGLAASVEAIRQFSDQAQLPTYLMLLPTSSAILQEQIPPYTDLYNNQKQVIEETYTQLAGSVTVVDVYPTLFGRRDQYIYYRTEHGLTGMGGYYVYAVLAPRMVRQEADLGQYNIEHAETEFYGSLYQQSPYGDVRPDVVSVFHYTQYDRQYRITHYDEGGQRTYHTLYPTHLIDLGREMDVYFGGISPVTNLESSAPAERSLLVFGDETAAAYLPFLANHYSRITLVDLAAVTPEQAEGIDAERYDQVLFAYSVENFDKEYLQGALAFLPETEDGEVVPDFS